jgi:hypothetical protein
MWIKSSDGKALINSVYVESIAFSGEFVTANMAKIGEVEYWFELFRGTPEEAQKYYDWLTKRLMMEEASREAAALRQSPPLLVTVTEPPPPRIMVEGVPYSMTPRRYEKWRRRKGWLRRLYLWLFHRPSGWE